MLSDENDNMLKIMSGIPDVDERTDDETFDVSDAHLYLPRYYCASHCISMYNAYVFNMAKASCSISIERHEIVALETVKPDDEPDRHASRAALRRRQARRSRWHRRGPNCGRRQLETTHRHVGNVIRGQRHQRGGFRLARGDPHQSGGAAAA